MSIPASSDPFANTTTVKNILQHVLSPKIVSNGAGGYVTKTDLVNIDTVKATVVYAPTVTTTNLSANNITTSIITANTVNATNTVNAPIGIFTNLDASFRAPQVGNAKGGVTVTVSGITVDSVILAQARGADTIASMTKSTDSFVVTLTSGSTTTFYDYFIAKF